MKKALLLGIFALLVYGAKAQSPAAATMGGDSAEFKFDVEEFNFGTITTGDTVFHQFDFVNAGKASLIITEAHGSCGCTQPKFSAKPIEPNEKSSIAVTFNSSGKMGEQDKTITISSNARGGQKILHLKGKVLSKEPVAPPKQ